ncbi:MAG: hypothetical protein M3083_20265 [Actinomycetota bacterium]|nr:hypothetical protein [Actinomycetota bacterium]
MFERFAEEARRATALASEEARRLNHDFIGTEHLLLGLVASAEGTAFSVLTELEVTLDEVRQKVAERVHAPGSGKVDSPPFTPLAKKSLERALREALQLSSAQIESEHLLLGLIAVPDGGGARILAELAGNLDQVREAVLIRVGPRPTPGEPVEQSKAPVTARTLRRWASQGRTVLRPLLSGATEPAGLGSAEVVGPPPRCPNCQSPLATEARYRQLTVPAGTETEGPEGAGPEGAGPEGAAPEPEGAGGTDDPDPVPRETVVITVVYCGHCGIAFGVA